MKMEEVQRSPTTDQSHSWPYPSPKDQPKVKAKNAFGMKRQSSSQSCEKEDAAEQRNVHSEFSST